MPIKADWYSFDNVKLAPDASGVYELGYRSNGAVVYIGSSESSIRARLVKHIERRDFVGVTHFRFRKTSHDAVYSPRDSEQPLRYILRFLLNLHINERRWDFFNFVRDWLELDAHLKGAAQTFAAGCKNQGGFAVLQGAEWFT